VRTAGHEAFWLLAAIALTRCYRESGDLGRSVATGERALERLAEQGLADADEAIQLSVTVAAAYFAQGDTGSAVRLCMQALERAEGVGSPKARAAAYWNASVMESLQGSVAAAIPLAERALALLGEGQDARNLARLRSQLGVMQLQLDPPEEELALRNLQQAGEELAACSASSIDIGRNDVATARALFLHGSVREARLLAEQTYDATRETAPLLAADARALAGQAAAAEGDIDYARAAYRDAVFALTGIGADRSAAELWLELGGLLEAVGDAEAARDAYRSAAVSSGVRARSAVSARV
jgi:tetratricopeptide (TPR) repeat protein